MLEVGDRKVAVIGAGASGLAAAELLVRRGAEVILNDRRERDALDPRALALEGQGVTLALGSHDPAFFEGVELVVLSPGVPPIPELAELFRDVEVIGEVELASRFLGAPLIAITGTNGKSTVTTLVGEMLRRSGFVTFLGGNLGRAACEAVGSEADTPDGRVVLELSSFQLEKVRLLRPKVAALLNLSPDHLDRYKSQDDYARAKSNIFAAQRRGDHAVLPANDDVCKQLGPMTANVGRHGFGGQDGIVRVEGDALVDLKTGWSLPLSEILLQGRHNHENAAAAVLVARIAGASPEAMSETLREVGGLPHRAAKVRELDGVTYIDDSKATNVGATVAALDGLASPSKKAVLIAGGVDKGGSYAPLVERLASVGRAVVLIGKSAQLIAREMASLRLPIRFADSMEAAVNEARSLAEAGDLVLLAPACSSFDMFRSYAHRGDVFQDAVRALPETPAAAEEENGGAA